MRKSEEAMSMVAEPSVFNEGEDNSNDSDNNSNDDNVNDNATDNKEEKE